MLTYFIIIAIAFLVMNVLVLNILEDNYLSEQDAYLKKESNVISVVVSKYLAQADPMLNSVTQEFGEELEARVLILNPKGTVISDSFNDLRMLSQTLKYEEIDMALRGESTTQTYFLNEHGWVMYCTAPITYEGEIIGVVLVSSSLNNIFHTIIKIRDRITTYSLIISIFIAVFSFVLSGYLTNPIKELTHVIKKMSMGHLSQRVKARGNSELSQLGRAFNVMSERLEGLDKARYEFVANASHELKTPLSSMKILIESLLHQDINDVGIFKEFLRDINSEIDRLTAIINDLLTLVQIDKQDGLARRENVYLNELIGGTIRSLKPLADSKNIMLQFIQKQDVNIMGDGLKLQLAFSNIIDNGIKYTEKGKVTVTLFSSDGQAVVEVEDTGVGIPKEDLKHIFDRFFRIDKARSRDTGGTGLGLSIAHNIILTHGGNISVESEEGVGTKFTITLPIGI
ncbi:MAG TPA: cell wall metabolism sensor histidine kinase WalK [Clostridiales bacterium]|nr:cell wall metabolism sensor histidine kinase WalK [Clostridiales bacterium]